MKLSTLLALLALLFVALAPHRAEARFQHPPTFSFAALLTAFVPGHVSSGSAAGDHVIPRGNLEHQLFCRERFPSTR